jgi:hypothetical protein
MATIDILVGQKVTLSTVATRTKIAAELVGIPVWTTGDATVTGLVPAEDGLSCVVWGKKVGSTAVTCNAQGTTSLSANHTVAVAAAANILANELVLTVARQPE